MTNTKKSSVMALLDATAAPAKTEVEAEASAPATEEIPAADPAVPQTKAQLLQMDESQLDNLYDSMPYEIAGWYDLNLAGKQKDLSAIMFGKKKAPKKLKPVPVAEDAPVEAEAPKPAKAPKAKKAEDTNKAALDTDPLTKVAGDIENMSTQDDVEAAITTLIAEEGLNDFRLGGLFQKLMEVANFGENVTFRQYVLDRFGVEYRKARYLIQNYNGVVSAGIAWDDVKACGWTKLSVLIPVLTAENVKEWVQKALAVNKETLKEMVKAALAASAETGNTDGSNEPVSNLTTKTFKLAADQLELVDLAVEDAKAKGNTEHNGVALEYICNAYLNGDLTESQKDTKLKAANAEAASLKKQVQDMAAKIAQLEAQVLETSAGGMVDPKQLFVFARQTYPTVQDAIAYIFGPEFDEVFPGVAIDLTLPKEVAGAA